MFVIICNRMALKRSRVMYYGSTYGDESRPGNIVIDQYAFQLDEALPMALAILAADLAR